MTVVFNQVFNKAVDRWGLIRMYSIYSSCQVSSKQEKEEGNTDVTDMIVPHMLREGL